MDEASDTTPLSPRVSDVSNGSRYVEENDYMVSPPRSPSVWSEGGNGGRGKGKGKWSASVRHAVGITLLLATVFLWTASNFLASVSTVPFLYVEGGVGNVRRR